MAIASPSTELDVCNMTLGRIGALRITDAQLTANTDVRAQHCNLHYAQTRDALLRSYWWRFAGARATLTTTTTPTFEWAYAFSLPDDFLAFRSIYEDNNTILKSTVNSFKIEGAVIMWDDSSMQIRYTKQVTTVTSFEPLFIEALVLHLALKLVMPLAQDQKLYQEIKDDLRILMPSVRAMDRQEQNNARRTSFNTWNNARAANRGRIDSKLGSS